MKSIKKFLFSIFLLLLAGNLYPVDIYVAGNGDDINGTGTVINPYKTLAKAKQTVRDIVLAGLNEPINVFIREGIYPQTESIVFKPEESGTPAYPITYKAYQNEEVIISGAVEITNWTQQGNLFVADVPGINKAYAFYSNNEHLVLARTPNVDQYYKINGTGLSNFSLYKKPEHNIPTSWENTGAYVNIFQEWKHSRHTLTNVDGEQIFFTPQERRPVGNWDQSTNYYLDNHIDMLDAPGEWFHDDIQGKLYYYPKPGETISTFTGYLPVVDRLIVFDGNPANGNFITNLNFEGLSFRYTNWNVGNGATLPTAYLALDDAVIWCFGLKDSKFENCEVSCGGGHGIWFYDGSKNNSVIKSEIHAIGGGGIYMKNEPGIEARRVTYSGNVLVEGQYIYNTLIYDLNNIHHGAHGIWLGNVEDITISHCDISGTDGSGINIGFTDFPDSVGARNVIVEYSKIHDLMTGVTHDWGGIHMLGGMPGTIIRNNYFYNIPGYGNNAYAIYHDNGNADVTVINNVITSTDGDAIFTKGARHLYENNIIISTGVSAVKPLGLSGSLTMRKNIFYSTNSRGIYHYGEARPKASQLNLSDNIYWCQGCQGEQNLDFDGGSFSSWQSLGLDQNSVVSNPQLGDIYNHDFSFSGSAATSRGINQIDISNVGLTDDPNWVSYGNSIPVKPRHPSSSYAYQYFVDQPFFDGFEDQGVGNKPHNTETLNAFYSTNYRGNNAPEILVTNQFSKSGSKSLHFRDQQVSNGSHNPNIRYYPMYRKTGIAILELDIKLEQGATFQLENRGATSEKIIIILTGGGVSTARGQTLLDNTPADTWMHLKVEIPISSSDPDLFVTLSENGNNHTVSASTVQDFKWHEALFLSTANLPVNWYLDNVSFGYLSQEQTYTLTVNNGSGDGLYEAGTVVGITADPAPSGQQFSGWTGDVSIIENVNSPATNITMPAGDASVTAGYEAISSNLVFDDFQDGNSSSWIQRLGLFNESGGVLNSGGDDEAYTGSTAWTDYSVEAEVTPTADGIAKTIGIMARYTSPGNYYSFRLNGNGSVQIVKYQNNEASGTLASTSFNVASGTTYLLKLELVGSSIKAYIDGQLVFDITDNLFTQGAPGVAVLRGVGYFDNFLVESLGSIQPQTYTLTVNNGSGDGLYEAGTVVGITADPAPSGQQFSGWTGDVSIIEDVNSPATNITMPAGDASVTAGYEAISSNLVFDDFQDGNSSSWIQRLGLFNESGGVLNSGGDDEAYTGSTAWTDYSVEAEVTPTADGIAKTIGIMARYTSPGNYYSFRLNGNGSVQIVKYQNNEASGTLASTSFNVVSGTTYLLKMELVGSSIKAYIDGQLVFDITDNLFTQGAPGVAVLRGVGYFDNFLVESLGSIQPLTYTLTVNNGSGDGLYEAGTVVGITADPAPSGQQFSGWTGDVSIIEDVNSPATNITMPAGDASVTAGYEAISSNLVFDDFQDGNSSSWIQRLGLFNESGGVLNSGGDDEAYTGSTAWTDYSVEAEVTPTADGIAKTIGIMARYTSPGNYYSFRLKGNGSVQIVKYQNNEASGTLASASFNVVSGTTYLLKMELVGSSIKAYIDGQLVFDITDNLFTQGAPGVAVLRGVGYFDNFKVLDLSSALKSSFHALNNGMEFDNTKMMLYPNPTNGIIKLSEINSYKVYSVMGILLLEGAGNEINVSNLSNQILLIEVNNTIYRIIKK